MSAPLVCLRYLYAGSLEKRPTRAAITRTLAGVVEATGLTPIEGMGPVIWMEAEQEVEEGQPRGTRWTGLVVVAESHVALSGHDRLAHAQISSCRQLDETKAKSALERHLRGVWREVSQESYEIL